MPSTRWSVPMSGVHMALRTLWMRIDFPLKRSSAAVLSERMATRSSTTLRAIDCGTCFEADDCAVRPREIRGTSSPVAASSSRIETRSTFITWNVNSTTLSSSRSSSCCLDSSFEISSNSSSFFSRSSSSDLALTFRCDAPAGAARPTTTLRPGCRSIDCSPVVLSSLNTGAKYTSPSGLGERQRLEHGLRLVLGLPELACRIRVGHDPGASLHHDPVPAHQRAADRDGGVQIRGTPADVPHRAGIVPAPLGLELVDDFHGAHLGRTRHGARGKAGLEHVERVVTVAQLSAHFAHEVLHVGVALDGEQVRDAHAAEPRHPPHVVPPQIHEHHVLGALLLVGAQLVGERVVLLAGAAARAGAGDGPDGDLAPLHPDQHFRRRSEEHTSELQSHSDLVCRLLLEKKK